MRKAISELVVIVMFLMIAVVLAGIVFVFITGFQEQAKTETQQTGETSFKKAGSCMEIISFDDKTNNLWVQNCANQPISNITVLVDNVPAYTDSATTINPKEIKPLAVYGLAGTHIVKLKSDYAFAETYVNMKTANGKIVFVSSVNYTGNLGGLSGADSKCQALASAVPALSGKTFKAWLSNSTLSARDRLTHSTVPYILLNTTVVANNWADLVDGTLQNPIILSEKNSQVLSGVWTGTDEYGDKRTDTCSDWTSDLHVINGRTGVSIYFGKGWTNMVYWACSFNFNLYCFEQ